MSLDSLIKEVTTLLSEEEIRHRKEINKQKNPGDKLCAERTKKITENALEQKSGTIPVIEDEKPLDKEELLRQGKGLFADYIYNAILVSYSNASNQR